MTDNFQNALDSLSNALRRVDEQAAEIRALKARVERLEKFLRMVKDADALAGWAYDNDSEEEPSLGTQLRSLLSPPPEAKP